MSKFATSSVHSNSFNNAITEIARRHNIISVADNAFTSPALQLPLAFGLDIVVPLATKYFNHHSDVVAELVVIGNREDLAQRLGYL